MAGKRNEPRADETRADDALAARRDPQRLRDEAEIDRLARSGEKSEWVERSAPAAGDPVTDDERRGLSVLGQSDPRGDGSIRGVSDASRDEVTPRAPADGSGPA